MIPGIVASSVPPAGGGEEYEGPLDLVPGAVVAYGNRALSSAMRGQPFAALVNYETEEEVTYSFDVVTGEVPSAVISSWMIDEAASVSSWKDQSGNNLHAVNATISNQPEWRPNLLNGKSGMRFLPNAELFVDGVALLQPAYTVFLVAKVNDQFSGQSLLELNSGDAYFQVRTTPSPMHIVVDSYGGADNETGGTFAHAGLSDSYHLIEAVWQFGNVQVLVDGVSLVELDSRDFGGPPEPYSGTLMIQGTGLLGSDLDSLEEIIVYNSLLSAPDRLAIRQNIADYYGITLP